MPLDTPILFAATTDAERSRAFYEKILGFRLLADEPVALVFEVGAMTLRIQKVVRKPKLDYTVLGWMVADIEAEIRRLSNAGVTFCRFESLDQDADGVWRSPGGAKVAWFRDPDGNTLSLTEKR